MTAQMAARPSLPVFTPDAVRAVIGFDDLLDAVAAAFVDFSRGLGEAPVSVFAPAGRDGDVHVKSACLAGRAFFTVKIATWFRAKAARGRLPGGGVIAVFDAATGDPVALLEDEHHVSDVRTAAAGALATRYLARPDAGTIGVVGTGVQAYLQVLAAAAVRPVRTVRAWGRNRPRAERLAAAIRRRRPDVQVRVVGTPHAAVEPSDIVVAATASTQPLVMGAWLRSGQHLTAVGADDPYKCELDVGCLLRADRLVVDSRALTLELGDIHRAVSRSGFAAARISAELGEVIDGQAAGRRTADEVTVCKLVGLGVQDLAAAEVAIPRLLAGVRRSPSPASAVDLSTQGPTGAHSHRQPR